MNVFELGARLFLNTDDYDSSLDEAEQKGSSFGDKLKSGLATGAKVALGTVTALTTATIAAGKALVDATGEVAAYGDTIDKESQKIGLSTDAYQEWDFILQHSGSSIAALTPAMKTLAAQAEAGSEAFQALGISEEEVASMSQEELFAATIEALQGMGDETERNQIASDLLGKSYMELQPLLNTSAEDTEAMRQAVHDLGGVMSEDAVKSAAAYQDALQDMNTAIDGTKREIIGSFMPSITTVMGGLTSIFSGDPASGVGQIKTGLSNLISQLLSMAPQFVSLANELLTGMLTVFVENLPELVVAGTELIMSLAEGILGQLPTIVNAAIELILAVTTYLIENLPEFLAIGIEVVESLATGLLDNLPTIISGVTDLLMAMLDFFLGDGLMQLIDVGIQLVFGLVDGIISNLPAIIQAAVELIISLVTGLIEHIPDIIAAAIELIGGLIVGLITAIPDIIAALPQIIMAIIDAFAETDWGTVGKNIIEGIVTGIGGAVSRLWDAAVNAAKQALQKIKNVLGISSPSKVFRDQIGAMIPEGMAIGIETNTDEVEQAMDDLAELTTDPFNNMTNVVSVDSGRSMGTYGGIVINVYPREGQDEEAIAEYVLDKLNMEYQREERALA